MFDDAAEYDQFAEQCDRLLPPYELEREREMDAVVADFAWQTMTTTDIPW